MMRGIIVRSAVLGITALGIVNISAVLSDSPAFSTSARYVGVFGDWRVPVATAMYDRATYLFQLGFGYINAETVASGATEGQDDIALLEVSSERAAEAAGLLEESVYLDPSNAHAWAALAWSYSAIGNLDLARSAMLNSWYLAPNNYDLSMDRLSFLDMLVTSLADTIEEQITAEEIQYSADDICVAKKYRSSELSLLQEESLVINSLSEELSDYCEDEGGDAGLTTG